MYLNAVLNTTCPLKWHTKFCRNLTRLLIMYKSINHATYKVYGKHAILHIVMNYEVHASASYLNPSTRWHTTDTVYRMRSLTVLLSFHSSVYLRDERYY